MTLGSSSHHHCISASLRRCASTTTRRLVTSTTIYPIPIFIYGRVAVGQGGRGGSLSHFPLLNSTSLSVPIASSPGGGRVGREVGLQLKSEGVCNQSIATPRRCAKATPRRAQRGGDTPGCRWRGRVVGHQLKSEGVINPQ